MKRLYILLAFMFCAVTCFAQYPSVFQSQGAPATEVYSRGLSGADSGFHFRYNFPDTSTANRAGLKTVSNLYLTINDTLWKRNNAKTAWMKIGSSVAAIPTWQQTLNESSLLLVDNVVDVNSTNLSFNNAQSFTIYNDAASTTRLKLSQLESDLFSVNGSSGLVVTNSKALFNLNTQVKLKDSVGSRLTSDWTQGSLPSGWSDNTPATSLTFTGAGMAVSGGAQDLNNHLDQGFYIGSPFWTIHQKVIVGSKNGTSYGFGFELKPAVGNGQTYLASYLLADTTGYIAFTGSNSFPTSSDPNNRANLTFKWSVGDTLDCYIVRQDRTAIITMYNLTTGMTSQLTYSVLFTGTSNLQLHFYGGSFTFIGSLDLTYNLVRNPAKISLGTSLTWGANATVQDSTFFSLSSSRVQGAAYNFGHPSEQAINGIENLEDILTYAQANQNTVVEVEYGVNEHNNAVPLDTLGARLRRICTPLIAAGCKVILINCVPQLTSVVSTNDTINSVANSFTPHIRVADIYTALVGTGTAINPLYAYGDNVHINNKGSVQAAGVIWEQEKDLLTIGSPVNATPLPTMSNPVYYVGMDATGNFGRTYPGTSNAFIKNTTTNDGTNIQTANFNISGAGWVGNSFLVQGFGNFSSPSFGVNVNADGYTKAALFLSKNFATSTAGYSYIDGTLSADPRLIFFSGAYIGAHQQPLLIKPDDPTTGAIGLRITNGTNSTVPSGYKIQTWERNLGGGDVVKMYVGGGGDIHADSTLYLNNMFAATPGDTTNYKVAVKRTSDGAILYAPWNYAGGGGGGGGVTSVATNINTGITGGTITTTGTIAADTLLLSTRANVTKVRDSLFAVLGGGGGTSWGVTGNAGTSAGTNYIGTSDNVAFDFRTNATQAMRLNTAQELMIGSTTDAGAYKLQVTGDSYTSGTANLDAAANQLQLRVSGTLTYQISSANVGGSSNPDLYFNDSQAGITPFAIIQGTGNVELSGSGAFFVPTAKLHLGAVTTAASTAPLKFSLASAAPMTSPEIAAVEAFRNRITYTDSTATRYILYAGGTPTIAAGTGAGTSPTISITGIDQDGYVSLTTGTLPTLSAVVGTITFSHAYGATPKTVILSPANSNAALLSGVTMVFVNQVGISTTNWAITAGTTALAAATAYQFYYHVVQ